MPAVSPDFNTPQNLSRPVGNSCRAEFYFQGQPGDHSITRFHGTLNPGAYALVSLLNLVMHFPTADGTCMS